jgi:hypothetical protein
MVKKRRSPVSARRPLENQRRARASFAEVLSSANNRAHEQANRKGGNRSKRYVWVADAADLEENMEPSEWPKRIVRWSLATLLLPFCWVTTWTFLSRFSQATVHQDFWKSEEFWYFATGALVMIGWFWSGLLQTFFLYLYVLGHELTHAVFVKLYRGKVSEFHVSADGGYITTNKTNLVIALSPYFVPFWSVIAALFYVGLRFSAGLSPAWDRLLYATMGVTWTFHMVWTLWMIPRDQPDLKENGTYLSLVVIFFANILVLVGLFCLAEKSPVQNVRDFGMEWLRHAATWSDILLRWGNRTLLELRAAGRF